MSWERNILRNGFTLFEFIIVMLIIGILSAMVVVQFNARKEHLATVLADQFRRDLSHIQLIAISQSKRLELSTTSGGYSVGVCTTSTCTVTTPLTDPATGSIYSVALTDPITGLPSGVTMAPPGTFDFDSLGRPHSGGGGPLIATTMTYTFSGSGRNVSVNVWPITGFSWTGP